MTDSVLNYDGLIGDAPIKTFSLAIKDALTLKRGTVMAYNTSTDEVEAYDTGGSNGVNAFYGILANDITVSLSNFVIIYIQGEFIKQKLIFDGTSGDSATQPFINSARALNCIIKTGLLADVT